MGEDTEVRERRQDECPEQPDEKDQRENNSDSPEKAKQLRWYEFEQPLVWRNIYIMAVIHLLCIYSVFRCHEAKWQTWIWFMVYYLMSGLGVTAGAHRLWAHRTYKAVTPYRFVLMLFNCISFQNDIIEWSRDHRVHHKYSETPADPHNAKRGFFFAHIGWLLMKKHPDVKEKGKTVDMSDLLNDPILQFQRRYYLLLGLICSVLIPMLVPWYFWGETLGVAFALCVSVRYIFSLHVTWLVNSAAHLWGSRPYDKTINPSENILVSFGAIGEGFHNYHHAFPHDYSASEYGPYLNMTTCIIDMCAALGLVTSRRKMTSKMVEARRERTGNPVKK